MTTDEAVKETGRLINGVRTKAAEALDAAEAALDKSAKDGPIVGSILSGARKVLETALADLDNVTVTELRKRRREAVEQATAKPAKPAA